MEPLTLDIKNPKDIARYLEAYVIVKYAEAAGLTKHIDRLAEAYYDIKNEEEYVLVKYPSLEAAQRLKEDLIPFYKRIVPLEVQKHISLDINALEEQCSSICNQIS